jgi:mRNA-degrading endonuclease RelE of RelBE toxin-antitoxin system
MVRKRNYSKDCETSPGDYKIIPSRFFLEQLEELSADSRSLIKEKLLLIKINPYRYKRIKGYGLFLFRIRFEDERKEKRVIYLLDGRKVKILCILDRDHEYKDLRNFLRRYGYL